MNSLMWASSVLKLYRRIFGSAAGSEPLQSGVETVLDGATAVGVTEASISEAAGLGGTFPSDRSASTWKSERDRESTNIFGRPLITTESGEPRGAISSAIGLSSSGLRAAAFVSGPDLTQSQDLLRTAVESHLPLVIHLGARVAAGRGSGHEAYHAVSDAGCFQLFAANVQQAVDFALVARRVAELSLVPGIVAMDSEQTALAPQDVHLPPPDLARGLVGSPEDQIPAPTEAQKMLFGETRRRVPLGFDLDRPLMAGAVQGPEAYALGAAGQGPFFSSHLESLLGQAFEELAGQTGRRHELVASHHVEDARIVIVAQGAAVESAEAIADWLRKERKQKVGVLGIAGLRPFPGARVAELLRGKQAVAVLERLHTPLAGDPPLLRELRSAIDRAGENGRSGSERPRFHSVLYGLGGHPLRGADLALLCSELETKGRSQIYLGVELASASSSYPKRQVLLDQLKRAYPETAELGLRSKEPSPDTRPEGAVTVAVHRVSGGEDGDVDLAAEAAALIQRLLGGHIRSRAAVGGERFAEPAVDRFTHASEPLRDPGDDLTDDIALLVSPAIQAVPDLATGATVLVPGDSSGVWGSLSESTRRHLQEKQARLFALSATAKENPIRREQILGGLAGIIGARSDIKPRKVLSARREMLVHLEAEEIDKHLTAFEAAMEGTSAVEYPASAAPEAKSKDEEVPMAVRRLGRSDRTLDSLPRFWDQVGVLYRDGATRELSADPYLATGKVPPLTSTFRDFSGSRLMFPAFDPQKCTGCGACWTWCPDGAIAPVAISPAGLLDAGMAMASGTDALRPVLPQLAGRVTTEIKKADPAPTHAAVALDQAFTWLQEKMPMQEERKQAVQQAYTAVREQVGALPIAKTAPFFDEPEARAKGSGELLTIAINPASCKGCGLCIRVCEPEAIAERAQNDAMLGEARRVWHLWEALPDTPAETIDRAREHPDVGPAAAMLLSRHCLMVTAGGDGAEAGSGEKIALRLLLAAVEYHQQPRVKKLVDEITETQEKLAARIHETLSDALPTSDLDALSEGLDALDRAIEHSKVDTPRLRREVDIAKKLADIGWRLTEGVAGMGRSRLSMAVTGDSDWIGAFPDNPFSIPVVVDSSGETARLAQGLVRGQLAAGVEAFIALRKARLVLTRPEDAERESAAIEQITWKDLDDEEADKLAPLIWVTTDESLAAKGISSLFDLLGADAPIKVVVLSGLENAYDLAFTALGPRTAFVTQTSISEPKHFYESVRGALAHKGPALVRVHAPSPKRHGFATDGTLEQARLAVVSRALPLFCYDPTIEGAFGLRLSLTGNPAPESAWATDEDNVPFTPADWALGEARFARLTPPLEEDAPGPTPVSGYLLLATRERAGKTPFVVDADGNRRKVAPELARTAEARLGTWQALQEVAGLVTPFTQRVREQAEQAVAEAHQAELRTVRDDYETQLKTGGEKSEAEIAERIKNQLLVLTGYKK